MAAYYGSPTLRKLRDDHRFFSVLLDAVAREADSAARGDIVDSALLSAIADYFKTYPSTHHHPCEELIYGHLICEEPQSAIGVFDLLEQHRGLIERADAFAKAVNHLTESARGLEAFVGEARGFVEDQRAHIAAEEKYFFPHAERCLRQEHWAEIERGTCAAGSMNAEDAARSSFPPLAKVLRSTETRSAS
jgi:hemerythrin-like domain-containing protein